MIQTSREGQDPESVPKIAANPAGSTVFQNP